MKGKFPDILNNPASGEAARKLYDDAQEMLDTLIKEKWLTANGVIGFFPANAVGDDIEVYTDETRTEVLTTLYNLRQQGAHRDGIPNRSLGDFIAPKDTGLADYVGAFAVTAGLGSHDKIAEFKAANDDYSAILLESLADRLAEAFAERLHQRARGSSGYQPDEHLDNEALSGRSTWASAPPPAIRHARSTPRRRRLGADGRQGADRHRADRIDGDVAGRCRQRLVLLASPVAVLRGRPAGSGPGRRLRETQGLDSGGSRALARPQPWLQPGGLSAMRGSLCSDMDGTLVDSEKHWDISLAALYEQHGGG